MWKNILMKVCLFLFELGAEWFIKQADADKNGEVTAEEGFNYLAVKLEKVWKKVKT